jgi:chemotaxis protein histidine kinase CheA
MSTPPIKTVADKAPPGEPTADSPGRVRPISMPASLGAANGTQPRKILSLADALAMQRDRRQRQQSFADDKGITFEEAGDALKKAREIKAAEKKQKEAEERVAAEKKQKEAEEAMKLQQQLEAERVAAEKKQKQREVERLLVERSKNKPLEEQGDTVKSEAQKSSPTASKPAVSELAESVSIPALRDIDLAPSLEHSPVPGFDGGPTGPEGGKSCAQPFLLITS